MIEPLPITRFYLFYNPLHLNRQRNKRHFSTFSNFFLSSYLDQIFPIDFLLLILALVIVATTIR